MKPIHFMRIPSHQCLRVIIIRYFLKETSNAVEQMLGCHFLPVVYYVSRLLCQKRSQGCYFGDIIEDETSLYLHYLWNFLQISLFSCSLDEIRPIPIFVKLTGVNILTVIDVFLVGCEFLLLVMMKGCLPFNFISAKNENLQKRSFSSLSIFHGGKIMMYFSIN